MDSIIRRAFEYTELLYASITDAAGWPIFLGKVSEEFQDASVALWHSDNRDSQFNISEYVRYEPRSMSSLAEHYYHINPWVQKEAPEAERRPP